MEILLNDSWSFHKENEASEQVRIPHTYNSVDGQSGTLLCGEEEAFIQES